MPSALFGASVLPDSVCESCRVTTGKFESYVLKQTFGIHRRAAGYPSRTKKHRRSPPQKAITVINSDGSESDIQSDWLPPLSITMPIMDAPSLAYSAPLAAIATVHRLESFSVASDVNQAVRFGGGVCPVRMRFGPYHPFQFCQFLAKVAHSHATAVVGVAGFRPLLRDFLLYGRGDHRMFVGGEVDIPREQDELFSVGLGKFTTLGHRNYLAVKIRLFSYMKVPVYTVIVGDSFDEDIFSVKNGVYAKAVKISLVGEDGQPLTDL